MLRDQIGLGSGWKGPASRATLLHVRIHTRCLICLSFLRCLVRGKMCVLSHQRFFGRVNQNIPLVASTTFEDSSCTEAGSYLGLVDLLVSLNLRIKGLQGPVSRVITKSLRSRSRQHPPNSTARDDLSFQGYLAHEKPLPPLGPP